MSNVVIAPRRSPRKSASVRGPPAASSVEASITVTAVMPTIQNALPETPSTGMASATTAMTQIPLSHSSPSEVISAQVNAGATSTVGAPAPQFGHGAYYPPYMYPQANATSDVQGVGLHHSFHYPHQWPYPMNHYYYQPSGPASAPANSVSPSQVSSLASLQPTSPSAAANSSSVPSSTQAAFGIDPAKLCAPPSYISSTASQSPPSDLAASHNTPPQVMEVSASETAPPQVTEASAPESAPVSGATGHSKERSGKRREPARDSEAGNHSEDDQDNDDEEDVQEDDVRGKAPSRKRRRTGGAKREVPSKGNPCCEYIEGAGTGEMKERQESSERIFRTRDLMKPYVFQAEATRHYRRLVPDILTRVESLAHRSGCYAYIALQHPDSGGNFYYFASEKLRMEAPEDTRLIHKTVGGTFTKLIKAYKSTKVDLVGSVGQAEARASEAEQKAASLQAELDRLKAAAAEVVPPSGTS